MKQALRAELALGGVRKLIQEIEGIERSGTRLGHMLVYSAGQGDKWRAYVPYRDGVLTIPGEPPRHVTTRWSNAPHPYLGMFYGVESDQGAPMNPAQVWEAEAKFRAIAERAKSCGEVLGQMSMETRLRDFVLSIHQLGFAGHPMICCRRMAVWHGVGVAELEEGDKERPWFSLLKPDLFSAARATLEAWLLNRTSALVAADQFMPATWFFAATGEALNPDTLRTAQTRSSVKAEKRGGRWFYEVGSVCHQWPEHRNSVERALNADKGIAS